MEFRIRGVNTNIPFLVDMLNHTDFKTGKYWTRLIDDMTDIDSSAQSQNRAQKLLQFFGDTVVNGNNIIGQTVRTAWLWEELVINNFLTGTPSTSSQN